MNEETARYLASYLGMYSDGFIQMNCYECYETAWIDEPKLVKLILEFFETLM